MADLFPKNPERSNDAGSEHTALPLHFQSWGTAFPLIILHGLLGSSDNWTGLSKRLAQDFAVYAVDQRNHGASPHSAEFNYDVMASDLRKFFADHSISQAHVMGHSMGGKTAMQFAMDYPELVSKLVVVDIAPKNYPPHHNEIFAALNDIVPEQFFSRSDVDRALSEKILDAPVRQFLLKNLTNRPEGGLQWKIDLESIWKNYDQITKTPRSAKSFSKPTLFIRGERSDYVTDADAPAIKAIFPESQIATIPNVGHWVHAESPNEFLRMVFSFLQES